MPSHLTRHVFRRLLANEPIVHAGCLRRRAYSIDARLVIAGRGTRQHGAQLARLEQRRSFFNFSMFRKPKREMKDADMDPGIEKMMELEKLTRMRARLPPPTEVAQAFSLFFKAKYAKKGQSIQDTQARLALQSLQYCFDQGETLSHNALRTAAYVLNRKNRQTTPDHLALAKELYDRAIQTGDSRVVLDCFKAYVYALVGFGHVSAAHTLVLAYEQKLRETSDMSTAGSSAVSEETILFDDGQEDIEDKDVSSAAQPTVAPLTVWRCLLRGYTDEMNEPGVTQTLQAIRKRKYDANRSIAATMIAYSVRRNHADGVASWWRQYHQLLLKRPPPPKDEGAQSAAAATISTALQWCLTHEQLDLGHRIVRDSMQASPAKPVWDAILVWAAGTGKGVDEIGRMLDVMERSNEGVANEEEWRTPDVATINALVEFAISKSDPYMAERFIGLGRDRGIDPDAKTYTLQMEYRLSVKDLDGALTAYKNSQALDPTTEEDVPTVNKLIVALCSSKRHDFDTIMNVAADLSDRHARFEPLTVSTLSLLHLNRDEIHDVIDLLNTHAYHYSSTERTTIRDALVAYCLDPITEVSRAWDAYTIIRNVFDELPRDPRTELMSNFFQRDRPDMAVHVFHHMRQHSRLDTLPTIDTYVSAFLGCAKRRDLESLEVLHNQLKLDYNINLNTYLRNALVIGYTACERPRKALGFWDDIVASREGPTYNSIHIALRACERSPFGDLKAKEIWEKLRNMNVELDASLWASYVAALAGNGGVEAAIWTVEEAEGKGELEVDAFAIGSLFAATPGYVKQGEVEGWARGKYPDLWEELVKLGMEEAEDASRTVNIDRSVTP